MFCQWFNQLEHLSVSSKDKSYPVHGLIQEGTYILQTQSVAYVQKTFHMMLA